MNRSPKKPRGQLVVQRPTSGWVGDSGDMPVEVLTQEDAILTDLVRAAAWTCGPDEDLRSCGMHVLKTAAMIIAERDAQRFYRIADAKRPRKGKQELAAIVSYMAAYRRANPGRSRKEFVRGAEDSGVLKVRENEGRNEYNFQLDMLDGEAFDSVGGEYVVRSLNEMWAKAGRHAARTEKSG